MGRLDGRYSVRLLGHVNQRFGPVGSPRLGELLKQACLKERGHVNPRDRRFFEFDVLRLDDAT